MANDALAEFKGWLPGELAYSAKKAGYDQKLERAMKDPADRQSMVGHLGSEWETYQLMASQGAHYMPFHGKSGQLQLAKFAAGIFDKLAVGKWIAEADPATEPSFLHHAGRTADYVLAAEPWLDAGDAINELQKPFDQTIFMPGIIEIMGCLSGLASVQTGEESRDLEMALKSQVMTLGGLAVACYQEYAATNLTQDQLVLPISELA